jgi:hypothetical protein
MQIKSTIILSAFLLTAIPALCSATDLGTPAAGNKIIGVVTVAGLPAFEFQPSTNVTILGNSTAANFSIAAYHESSLGTTKGEAYGMASDVSGVYTIATLSETAPTIGTTGKAADFTGDWEEPLGASDT